MTAPSTGPAATSAPLALEFDEFDRRGKLVTLSWEGAQHLSQTGLVEVPKVSWEDVGGLEDVKLEL